MVRILQLAALAAAPCAGQDVFLKTITDSSLTDSVAVVKPVKLAAPKAGNYEPECQEDDRGWPRFASKDKLQASKWATYFMEVYGEFPAQYPVCIKDFWHIDAKAFKKANITEYTPVEDLSKLKDGDLFGTFNFAKGTQLAIYHETYEPAPANTWIEVTHTAFPSEKTHQAAIAYLKDGCSVSVSKMWPRQESDVFGKCAREKGLDSIQFEPTAGAAQIGTFGIPGKTELVITGLDGQYHCGTKDAGKTTLRSGWKASRQCGCENLPFDEACGLLPRAPFPFGIFPPLTTDPPICELQSKRFWKNCDSNKCSNTVCKVPSEP